MWFSGVVKSSRCGLHPKREFFMRAIEIEQLVSKIKKAIDDEVDWFIAYFQEKDRHKKEFYHSMFLSKQTKRLETAKEIYEQLKQ